MSKEILIDSYGKLLSFIKENDLTSREICQIIKKTIAVFGNEDKSPGELKEELEQFLLKYEKYDEKPLFLDNK